MGERGFSKEADHNSALKDILPALSLACLDPSLSLCIIIISARTVRAHCKEERRV